MNGIMPPGHENWDAFERMVAECPWSRGRALRFLRDRMVMVQVSRYLSLIFGLWMSLAGNLALAFGCDIDCGYFVLVCVPWITAAGTFVAVEQLFIAPEYARMSDEMLHDPAMLALVRRACEDDYVLRPALERIERGLAKTGQVLIPTGA